MRSHNMKTDWQEEVAFLVILTLLALLIMRYG